MAIGSDFLRELHSGEEDAVDALLRVAFQRPNEANLVRKLRKSRIMAGEQVMVADGQVIAYCGLSRMISPKKWLCLAPVAVHPGWQGRRCGRRMVGLIGEWARISRTYVVVLGSVQFYQAAGFDLARAVGLISLYPVKNTLIAGPGNDVPAQKLIYPAGFDEV